MITTEQIKVLFDHYLHLIKLEVDTFKVKPTEVRHLIGRLGEFYCALKVGGMLAHTPNQHGFDVVDKDNKRISVKTTAQENGFVAISSTTLNVIDELMIIQYTDGELEIVYHGSIEAATKAARFYKPTGKYELDIRIARGLPSTGCTPYK